MKVLDTNFLIDYLDGVPATEEFYEANGGSDELWIVPAPAYAEVLVGVGNLPDGTVSEAADALAWTETREVDSGTAIEAANIASEIGPQGPFLDGVAALVAAVGRRLNAPVVSADSDLTHEETGQVIVVETYRRNS